MIEIENDKYTLTHTVSSFTPKHDIRFKWVEINVRILYLFIYLKYWRISSFLVMFIVYVWQPGKTLHMVKCLHCLLDFLLQKVEVDGK